jgi:uncharacterized membrane protein YqjE
MNGPDRPDDSHGPGSLLTSMARTRLELAALDLETHMSHTLGAMIMGAVALVVAFISIGFIGQLAIIYFWDTHRLTAAAVTTLAYVALATTFAVMARARWRSRPPAFAAVLRELECDRDALRVRL